MEVGFLQNIIPKILGPIPTPVIFWIFVLSLLVVGFFLYKKVLDMRGE